MRITVVGPSFKDAEPTEFIDQEKNKASNHSVCSMTLGLARALQKAGYQAEAWVLAKEDKYSDKILYIKEIKREEISENILNGYFIFNSKRIN